MMIVDADPSAFPGRLMSEAMEKAIKLPAMTSVATEAYIRRYRYGMIAAFVLGIVCGSIILALILSTPANSPLITFNVGSGILLAILQQSRIIATVFISGLICFFIISVVHAVDEIIGMKEMMHIRKV